MIAGSRKHREFCMKLNTLFYQPIRWTERSFPYFSKSLKSFDNDTRLRCFEGWLVARARISRFLNNFTKLVPYVWAVPANPQLRTGRT